jgi:hypothetical protein
MKIYCLMFFAGLFFSAHAYMPYHDYQGQCKFDKIFNRPLFVCGNGRNQSSQYWNCLQSWAKTLHASETDQFRAKKVLDYMGRDAWSSGCPFVNWNIGF